jgi:demethylmenaquinone methyltransferase/2-methoxy-6-polyprenyl-1,4-benzoquinol methylase
VTKDSASAPPDEPSVRRDVVTRANLDASLRDPTRKQAFVTPLFDLIAARYDRFTHAFSYGMDARWKRELVSWIVRDVEGAEARERFVLDVACGTGDLALLTARALPAARITGVDLSEPMLALARARVDAATRDRLTFAYGDLARLDAADESADLVTAGYAVRNAPDPRLALGELARVLRPGGRLYVLDFFRPAPRAWRTLYLAYLRATGLAVGWWWHRAPAAYEYIAASIARFVTYEEFVGWLSAAGFRVDRVAAKLGGGVALVSAVRR